MLGDESGKESRNRILLSSSLRIPVPTTSHRLALHLPYALQARNSRASAAKKRREIPPAEPDLLQLQTAALSALAMSPDGVALCKLLLLQAQKQQQQQQQQQQPRTNHTEPGTTALSSTTGQPTSRVTSTKLQKKKTSAMVRGGDTDEDRHKHITCAVPVSYLLLLLSYDPHNLYSSPGSCYYYYYSKTQSIVQESPLISG
ncbi:hypothetical protein Pelo_2608 [Pelomyxa schiedti]|nr:hypothetical protein Pelo_2608 [Pelomyxa schiedti]